MIIEKIINYTKETEPKNCDLFLRTLESLKLENKELFTMVELGCDSAYYSALFHEYFLNKAKNVLVEPFLDGWKKFGETYFKDKNNIYFYNNYVDRLVWAGWGGPNNPLALKIKAEIEPISFADVLNNSNTQFIDILHMDLQGTEYYILEDIIKNDYIENINYLFIMTHEFNDIRYQDYINLMNRANCKFDFIFNNQYYKENGDGLILVKINKSISQKRLMVN